MSLLSGLLVNGIRNTGSTALSRAIGGAVGNGVSGLGGGGGSGYAPAGSTRASGTATPAPTTVEGVSVNGQAPAPALDGAVGDVISNVGANLAAGGPQSAGSTTVDGLEVRPEAAAQDPAIVPGSAVEDVLGLSTIGNTLPQPTDVSGVDVTGLTTPAAPAFNFSVPTGIGAPEGKDLSEVVVEGEKKDDGNGLLIPGALALGAAAGLAGMTGGGGGATATSGGDGKLPLGVTPTDIVAGGLLGAGLLGGSGGTGSAGDAIKDLAASNKELAGRLGGIAEAGFQGNIGAKGLNSISRMVRKAQAAIRQRYAAMGMSGSTAEGDDLNAAVESGVDLQFKIGQQMAQTGLNAVAALTGQSAQAYLSLLNAQTQRDTALGSALANFAAAVSR